MPTTRRSSRRSASEQRELPGDAQSKRKRKTPGRRSSSTSSSTKRRRSTRKSSRKSSKKAPLMESVPEDREQQEDNSQVAGIQGVNLVESFDDVSNEGNEEGLEGIDEVEEEEQEEEDLSISSAAHAGLRRRVRQGRDTTTTAATTAPTPRPHTTSPYTITVTPPKEDRPDRRKHIFSISIILLLLLGIYYILQLPPSGHNREAIDFSKMKAELNGRIKQKMKTLGSDYDRTVKKLKSEVDEMMKNLHEKYENFGNDNTDVVKKATDFAKEQIRKNPKFHKAIKEEVQKRMNEYTEKIHKKIDQLQAKQNQFRAEMEKQESALSTLKANVDTHAKDYTEKKMKEIQSELEKMKREFMLEVKNFKKTLNQPIAGEQMSQLKIWTEQLAGDTLDLMINKYLEKFAADRTGIVDYAMAATRGRVVDHSPTYKQKKRGVTNIMNFLKSSQPISRNPPAQVLKPGIEPGNCWSMEGADGFVLIRLSKRIVPDKVSLEHASPKILLSTGSAPKDFEVYGTNAGKYTDDMEKTLLGRGTYDLNGKSSLQQFNLKAGGKSFNHTLFKVKSNYGEAYTCIYRIRIHGSEL
mmetsp:Transcript_2200/g.3484  ORF Transcript_2200/g.3484 Transcript_2200/m.3484 type:complete len:581 (-) Transcript_2200:280-2022(-)